MRFMLLKFAHAADVGALPDAQALTAVEDFNQALRRAGVLLAHDQLLPPTAAAGSPAVSGANTTGVLTAYWLIQARSGDEAVAWARRCPVTAPGLIDIRQVLPSDQATR